MKRFVVPGLVCVIAGCSGPASPTSGPPASRPVHAVTGLTTDRAFADEVRTAFRHAWAGYVRHAWGHDELLPVSGGYRDWYGAPLLMTPVDAWDTMRLMGLTSAADSAKALILGHLSFDHDMPVQLFEVNIRLLGGLLAAYQMDGDPRWLGLATDLGDRLLPAFDSPTGMPYVLVNLATGATEQPRNNPAEIGTLQLEFGLLSRLTGDPRYGSAVRAADDTLYALRSPIGLVGSTIDVDSGAWLNKTSHVGGGIDSYYEYLLKSWLLLDDPHDRSMWLASDSALDRYIADERDGHLWYGPVDMDTGERKATTFGALQAYLPAVLALSGDLPRAERLMESVYSMWTRYGIEPESFDYVTGRVSSPGYVLRPEAIESTYYLFILTGKERYRDMGRDMFERIVKATRVDGGFTRILDVRTGEKGDWMPSFFLAETLKYAYLLADPGALDFDAVVFNTEAHPLRPAEAHKTMAARSRLIPG